MALDGTWIDREYNTKITKVKLNSAELLAHARRKSGRKPISIGLEVRRLGKAPGTIRLKEYVQYGLYDDSRFSRDQKLDFIGEAIYWPVVNETSDKTWMAATEDKWLASSILRSSGLDIPETRAVIDKTPRHYGGVTHIDGPDALRNFVTTANEPLFCKLVRGLASFGAFRIEGGDDTHIHLAGLPPMTYQGFLDECIGEHPYLLQKTLQNHEFFKGLTTGLSTIRMCTFVRDDGLFVPFVVLKLVGGGNVADNFWRPGNIICDVDPATGTIRSIVTQSGIDLVYHDSHPETGIEMIGKRIPDWDRVLETTRTAGLTFAPVRYQSLDIALTETGPVVVEINTGGAWDLPQMATGKGFLTQEVREAFREMGVKRF